MPTIHLKPILLALLMLLPACGPAPTPTEITHAETIPPTASVTPKASEPPAPAASPIPRPTSTATALPGWVTDFAQPILDAISGLTPSFQDDFGAGSAGWKADEWCGSRMEYVDGEMVVTDCRLRRAGINYTDFVVEFDARYLPEAADDPPWGFRFRAPIDTGSSHGINITYTGDVIVHAKVKSSNDPSETVDFSFLGVANKAKAANHVLIIARGPRFAVYVNDTPLCYFESNYLPYGDFRFFADGTILGIDNFRIWDIGNLPIN